MPNIDLRFQRKSYPNGKSAFTIKNQVQRDQSGNRFVGINVPVSVRNGPTKNVNMYDVNLIGKAFIKNKFDYTKAFPTTSSKVLGDSYLTNIAPFNKQYRYDYKILIQYYGFIA